MHRRLPPTLRFAAIPLAIVLLLIAGLYQVVGWRVSKVLLERTAVRVDARAFILAQRLGVAVDSDTTKIQLLADVLQDMDLPDTARLRALLAGIKARSPEFVWLGFADATGVVTASSSGISEGQSMASQPVFAKAQRQTFVGDIHQPGALQKHLPTLGSDDTEVSDIGVPVRDARGQLRGVLVAHLSSNRLVSVGRNTVKDEEGSRLGLHWAWIRGSGTVVPSAMPFALPSDPDGLPTVLQGTDGHSYLVRSSKVPMPNAATDLHWTVVVYQDLDAAATPATDIQRALAIAAVLAVVLLTGVGYLVTRRAARPFERLYQAAEKQFDRQHSRDAIPFGDFIDQLSTELERNSVLEYLEADHLFIRRLAGDAQQFKRVIDHLPLGICISDVAFRVQYINLAYTQLLGWEIGQVRGERMPEYLVCAAQRESFERHREAMSDPPGELAWRLQATKADGKRVAIQCHMIPLFNRADAFAGTMMLFQDISAELGHRDAAEAVSQRLSIFAQAVTDYAFTMLDARGRFIEWSRGASLVTGWAREEVLENSLQVLLQGNAQSVDVLPQVLEQAKQAGSVAMDRPLRRRDGSVFLAGGALYHLKTGDGDDQFALIFSDETKLRSEAQAMAQSEARLNAVIDSASDAVISTDIHGTVQLFNPAAERIFQVSAREMLGSSLNRLLPPSASAAHRGHLHGFAQSNTSQRSMGSGKVEGIRADGTRLELEASISRAHIGNQTILTAILRDVTERSRVERALIANQTQLAALAQNLLTQERETTQRLAQALHDDLGQTLAAQRLIYDAGSKKPGQDAALPAWIVRLDHLIDDANRQVRRVLAELRPPLLDELGLYAALDNELRNRKATHDSIKFDLHWTGMPESYRIPPEVEYVFFTIAREAVGNAIRHASPSTVRVDMKCLEHAMQLRVVDDGSGKDDLSNIIVAGHLGLVGMRERALAIGAKLSFTSSVENGTTVELHWGNTS